MYADFLLSSLTHWAKTHLATSTLVVAVSVGWILHWIIHRPQRNLKLPPGPWLNLPWLGYLPFLGTDFVKGFGRLSKKYGPVYRLKLGQRSVLVLNDFPSVKEAFLQRAFLGRPPNPPNHLLKDATSFSVSNGVVWREQKNFALHVMRDLGFGKTRMEVHIKEEIAHLLSELEEFEGRPANVRRYLAPSTSNNISALIFGRRLDYHDPMRVQLDEVITELIRFFRPTSLHAWFPGIKTILFKLKLFDYDKLEYAIKHLLQFIAKEIDEHESTLDSNNIRDYMDGFLLQMKQREYRDPNTSFTKAMLKGNSPSLIGAGSTTVRATMEWSMLSMAEFQDVQARIHAEIDEVIGRERTPEWADHIKMPFTEAVLMEIQRWKTVVPINLLRYTTEPAQVAGYDIPAGMTTIANIHAIHNDPDFWEQPELFKPERFLSEDGKEVVKHECWIPFSLGKRACPGETLANVELFLYFTSLLQKFHIVFPEGKRHNFQGRVGATFEPLPYELCMIPRK
ncbi:cytochrome P450 2J6-like [Argiope bruennichi]|uniref:cytochrome P450 2J6-like n=1 Tax=Argiope bruennichi TaxID=94029 RepID=UPI002493E87F|nr:cytochrome P450 2J6-like [Argiope bruennichi]